MIELVILSPKIKDTNCGSRGYVEYLYSIPYYTIVNPPRCWMVRGDGEGWAACNLLTADEFQIERRGRTEKKLNYSEVISFVVVYGEIVRSFMEQNRSHQRVGTKISYCNYYYYDF